MYNPKIIHNYSKEEILSSIGFKFKNLSIMNLRNILTVTLMNENVLDRNIMIDNEAWDIIHKGDAPKLSMNEQIAKILLLSSLDVDFVESFYSEYPDYNYILNDPDFLKQLVTSFQMNAKPLLGESSQYQTDYNYENLITWLKKTYYNKDCILNHEALVCYLGAQEAGDKEAERIYYNVYINFGELIIPIKQKLYKYLTIDQFFKLPISNDNEDLSIFLGILMDRYYDGQSLSEEDMSKILENVNPNTARYAFLAYPEFFIKLNNASTEPMNLKHIGGFSIRDSVNRIDWKRVQNVLISSSYLNKDSFDTVWKSILTSYLFSFEETNFEDLVKLLLSYNVSIHDIRKEANSFFEKYNEVAGKDATIVRGILAKY